MALRVWLPLNGNINNQGLSTLTPSGTPTFLNDGKMGKCISLTPRVSFTGLPQLNNFTILFWLKVDSCSADWADSLGFTCKQADGSSAASFRFEATKTTRACSFHNNSPYGITSGSRILITEAQKGTWHHCGFSYDGEHCYTYIDGVLTYTDTGLGGYLINYFHIGETNNMVGGMNDLRIYDECLSQKQIKEIAKGLAAHYKLDNKYLEATTNLLTLETFSPSCYNGATNKYGYGENTDIYKEIGVFQNKKSLKIHMGTSGLSARPYPYVYNLFVSDGTNAPAYKTLSFDYYGTIGNYLNPYKLGSGSGTCTWTNNKTLTKSGSFTDWGSIPVVLNEWQHITMTLHGTTAANSEWGYIIIGDAHTSNINNYWLFANVQLEVKDHETGYVEGSRTAQTYESDSSGYGYNGTIAGTLKYSNNSSRYSGSTDFSTPGYLHYLPSPINTETDAFTFTCWFYPTRQATMALYNDRTGTGNGFSVFYLGSGLRFDTSNSSQYQSGSITVNAWNFIACVFDKNNTIKRTYINGAQVGSTTAIGNLATVGTNASIGNSSTNGAAGAGNQIYGSLSDVRIYMTALSANDILTMYKNSGIIDNKGNIYAYEFKEE